MNLIGKRKMLVMMWAVAGIVAVCFLSHYFSGENTSLISVDITGIITIGGIAGYHSVKQGMLDQFTTEKGQKGG